MTIGYFCGHFLGEDRTHAVQAKDFFSSIMGKEIDNAVYISRHQKDWRTLD